MARYNPNKAKINRSYTFEELAAVYGVHKNTVASWVKNGLPSLNEKRPFLILGAEVRRFHQGNRLTKKQHCQADEMFCMSCSKPTKLAENYVEYIPISETKGRLTGICVCCDGIVNKFVGLKWLAANEDVFEVPLPRELEHII